MKRYLPIIFIALLIPFTAAETNWNQTETVLTPGNTTTIGEINETNLDVTAQNPELNLGTPVNLETQLWNISEETYSPSENITRKTFQANINVTVPSDYSPESDTVDSIITYEGTNTQSEFETQYEVPEINNWTYEPQNMTGAFNVGEEGEVISRVNVTQQGNVPQTAINYNITGNVTQLLADTQGERTLYSGQDMPPIAVVTNIPEDQQWGTYTGTFNLTDSDSNYAEIPMDVNVTDVQAPEIPNIDIPDWEATTSQEIRVGVDDNINTTEVNGTIYRIDQPENVSENETAETTEEEITSFQFGKDEDGFWAHEMALNEVSEYRLEVRARDGSGNIQTQNRTFEVVKLDAIQIENQNFKMDTKRIGDLTDETILTVERDTPFNITLDFFEQSGNESVTLGIRKEDEETARNWETDQEDPKLEFEEEGTYILEANSEQAQTFEGTITVEHIDEHVELDQVFFEGIFINPEYLEPEDFSIGEFRGTIGYEDEEATVKNRIKFEGTAPAENCEGVESWTDCITGFTMGEYENVEQEKEDAQDSRDLWRGVAIGSWAFTILFVFFMIRKNQLKGTNVAYKRVSY
jgi:hypothetical protein